MSQIAQQIAKELNAPVAKISATIGLIDEGATVPFIARYRKEVTGGLDDIQLRQLETRLIYLNELEDRRQAILKSLTELDKLSPDLKTKILQADSKTLLEDLYLPYKPKRRTKAEIAKEKGLEPLANALFEAPTESPEDLAKPYISEDKGVADIAEALDGARHILMERFAESADLIGHLREHVWQKGILTSKVSKGQEDKGKKFKDYFDFQEPLNKIPSHRALALFRGRREKFLSVSIELEDVEYCHNLIASEFGIKLDANAQPWLTETVVWTWKVKLSPKLDIELLSRLKEMAEEKAIDVFAQNLKDLLLLAPAGQKVIMGLDPGIRTGVKVIVVDKTGKVLDDSTVYPLPPQNQWHESIAELAKLIMKHHVELVSIGNGTGSRETDRLVSELMKAYTDLNIKKIVVNEAGASIYSASELASKEFPDLDVSLRGAVSIARRLQDPLAELVKIEPKSIGVGQYQHDVNQVKLSRSLSAVVEDCVNAVGVNINTASKELLKFVAGLSESTANALVKYRDDNGPYQSRADLLKVPKIGDKTFEQCAAFLRIPEPENPLDASAVHPESYDLVHKILDKKQITIKDIIGNSNLLKSINAEEFVDEKYGLPTIKDVLKELDKPGRDPRGDFKTASFKEGVEEIAHLQLGMILEGVVSNVTNFGAFVDIGVHQDGLVHISEMTNQFIDDPRKVVKTGDVVKVKVIELDIPRRRISLTMKLAEDNVQREKKQSKNNKPNKKVFKKQKVAKQPAQPINSAMADAFLKLKR